MCGVESKSGQVLCRMLVTRGVQDECLLGQDWLCLNARIGGIKNWQEQMEAESLKIREPQRMPKILEELLKNNESIFSPIDSKGCTNQTMHKIEVMPCQKPVKVPVRKVPLNLKDRVREKLWELEREGIIRKSKSPWAAGLVTRLKKNGRGRLCGDFKPLNSLTVKDN